MMKQKMIDPMQGYWVIAEQTLTDLDRKVLIDLYQPLVGSDALSLYQLLWGHQVALLSDRKAHAQLLNLLDIDATAFYVARIKLEAVGLLRTFSSQDSWGDYLIYQLTPPATPKEFFQTNILKTFLYEKIGQNDFKLLQQKYCPTPRKLTAATEITQSFFDVFQLSNKNLLTADEKQSKSINANVPQYNTKQMATFDWDFLQQLVAQYQITTADVMRHQSELFNLHVFYGVSEMELANLLGRTVNRNTNQIDMTNLQRQTQKAYEQRVNLRPTLNQKATVANNQDLSQFTTTQRELIKQANQLSPAEFLAMQKHSKNGDVVYSSETRVLRQLQSREVLSAPVLNILVAYVLENSSTLTQSFVEKVASDWVQHKVQDAPGAVKRIQDFATKKNSAAPKYRKTNNQKVETGTDWAKHKVTNVDQTELQKLQQQLKDHS
ncbi:DnaD domain protein [Bombilactobacillus thymidiniphilus]|uniref:DnaD domain protein n=1 Tax=Bombilactobacillus thymidiniphilus TaxID=2923363 RepID=A0ABY4PCN7_9LACO|nr:DnaD domain protein [Bombilactobacillus thymidiniphilus]UQS83355.1 DnaD domain protein [Bombilactobacillus thymidiniphilus]